mmetsp:Transcript_29985/g.84598  ORF Transcript_29985/g.84598 Transcript_29985/m.84598 type:complete len:566 (+) Transcript_29985:117-1814(+)
MGCWLMLLPVAIALSIIPACNGVRDVPEAVKQCHTSDFLRPASATHLHQDSEFLSDRSYGESEAQQVHVTLGGPGEAVVVYATKDYEAESVVRFGTEEGSLDSIATGDKRTYTVRVCPEPFAHMNPMPGPAKNELSLVETIALQNTSQWLPAESAAYHEVHGPEDVVLGCWPYFNNNSFYESPTIHTVRLKNLAPSTTYHYTCGTQPTRSFKFTMPPAVGPEVPLRVGLWADVGQSNISAINARNQMEYNADINLLAGDLSYADGVPWRWDSWGRLMQPLLSEHLHLFCPGNHDIASGSEQGVAYTERYPSPWRSSGSSSPLWYSIDIGPMHLISLAGSYSPIGPYTAQRRWLEKDLVAVDRSVTPWLVVMWHVPWYNSNENHRLEAEPMRKEIEDLLVDARVNLVINGHVHSYERSHPMVNFKHDDCGPVHVVVGDGGNYEGPALPWRNEQPEWSAFREGSYGTGSLEIESSQRAVWRWRRRACVTKQSGMLDVWTHLWNATYYVKAGDAKGDCATSGDNAEMMHAAVDEFVMQQHPAHCSRRSRSSPGAFQPDSETNSISTSK